MATIDVNKLKLGTTYIDYDGDPYKVMKYDFIKMGRGKANIKVKARNLLTGAIVLKSYLSGNKVESADIMKVEMQYLYTDGALVYFMDLVTYEQIEVGKEIVGDDINYLVEGENAYVQFWGDRVIGVEVPASVIMEVKETENWIKGNSATNVYKPATMSSGLVVQVPLFVKNGDKIKINTSTGEYVNRA